MTRMDPTCILTNITAGKSTIKQNLHTIITVTLGDSDYVGYHEQLWPVNFLENKPQKAYLKKNNTDGTSHFRRNPFQSWFISF